MSLHRPWGSCFPSEQGRPCRYLSGRTLLRALSRRPGSLLDAGSDELHVRAIELLVHAVHDVSRSLGHDWGLDGEPLSAAGHLGEAVYRERPTGEGAADKRSADLAVLIKSGAWDPETRRTPPKPT
jgi:hypothetical protein